jgi:hypothetical protein
LLAPLLAVAVSAQAAEPKKSSPATTPIQPAQSGAEIVGKLLAPGPSDPDVPLPSRDLSEGSVGGGSLTKPRIYGREETGGAVFGLRFPIPVRSGASKSDTRYSSGE